MLFAHSSRDVYLAILSVVNLTVILWPFMEHDVLSPSATVLFAVIGVIVTCTNYQCIAHNFIHNPFFVSSSLNFLFSVFNTLSLGVPQSLYRVHHLLHHRYNNCPATPRSRGEGYDPSSIYDHSSVPGTPEPIVRYALYGPLRTDIRALYAKLSKSFAGRCWSEVAALVGFWIALAAWEPKTFLYYYLPVWYLGQVAAHAENYLEHYGADPYNKLKDSVSCYGKAYNLIWFNNGYHQEHHSRPSVHWSRVTEVTDGMLPIAERRVVPVAHVCNLQRLHGGSAPPIVKG